MNTVVMNNSRMGIYLRLGRVSNLPTVWTNVLAGAIVAGSITGRPLSLMHTLLVMLAISAFYCAGMYLNDAFDREIDARERPGRPIPSGQISARAVFAIGFVLQVAGIAILSYYGTWAIVCGCALAATILLYNVWHKGNPLSPLIMGLCRSLVYFVAAASVMMVELNTAVDPLQTGTVLLNTTVVLAALAIWAHVVGLTYVAKQESLNRLGSLWPLLILALPVLLYGSRSVITGADGGLALLMLLALIVADVIAVRLLITRHMAGSVPKAVAQLIAATSLLDALVIAIAGGGVTAVAFCLCAFVLTRVLQRVIPGT
ncbi:UbiA family prenyltransferase [Undibacterium pigrum]|uniref:4-hydroxybenzoate polyprenyltransferase n=1 Tax=Undibacterium pigrum TaxID=401470 RepID=A0A318JFK3_9BURK|nr:UbiA family prenyltransferase [Undibacterium pigrum]PXX42467.1 4-hydroxybenzoate polyprenyltransferase [Undibacterium pigrum]